jgi:O-antigen/teichoic acid export membrane protein
MIGFIFSLYFSYTRYYKRYFAGVTTELDTADRNHFIRYALATLMTANIGVILSQVDMQMIIILLGPEATGYYSNYLSLLNIPFIFISPLFSFLFPVISELHGREDKIKMRHIHREFSLYFSIIGIWLSVFLYQFGEPLAILFFGEKFRESGIILGYSAFFLTFLLLIQINFQFLAGTGKIGERARILAIILPINIVLNYILITLSGVE